MSWTATDIGNHEGAKKKKEGTIRGCSRASEKLELKKALNVRKQPLDFLKREALGIDALFIMIGYLEV